MNIYGFLYYFAWATLAIHLVSAAVTIYLIVQAGLDLLYTTPRTSASAVARFAFLSELDRFGAQVLLGLSRVPAIVIALDPFNDLIEALSGTIILTTLGSFVVALLLTHSSIEHLILRRRLAAHRDHDAETLEKN